MPGRQRLVSVSRAGQVRRAAWPTRPAGAAFREQHRVAGQRREPQPGRGWRVGGMGWRSETVATARLGVVTTYTTTLRSEIRKKKQVPEIPVVGEVDDWEAEVVRTLLEVPQGGACTFYIDSAGGSVYGALAVLTLLRHRQLKATAVV